MTARDTDKSTSIYALILAGVAILVVCAQQPPPPPTVIPAIIWKASNK